MESGELFKREICKEFSYFFEGKRRGDFINYFENFK